MLKRYRSIVRIAAILLWGFLGYQYFYGNLRDGTSDKYHLMSLYSKLYDADRDIIIRLPADYNSADIDYPLIVKLDGFSNLALHDEALDQINKVSPYPDAIIVAIPSAAKKRLNELTPTGWTLQGYDGVVGEGDKFLEFVAKDVIPYVTSNYRTDGSTYITGNSLGGLMSVYAIIQYPKIFNGGFVFSPSFWANDQAIVPLFKKSLDNGLWSGKLLFMALGSQEPQSMKHPYTQIYKAVYRHQPSEFIWKQVILIGGTHSSTQPRTLSQAYHLWSTSEVDK